MPKKSTFGTVASGKPAIRTVTPEQREHDSVAVANGDLGADLAYETTVKGRAPVLMLACGALAKEILALLTQLPEGAVDVTCLPAQLHNTPHMIVPRMQDKLEEVASLYQRIFIAYADCGTGGALDRLLAQYDHVQRLPGAHCYATYAGQSAFADLMQQELGTFFLTDYMVRHFDTLIMRGMGLDKHPELLSMYFHHYTKVVYLAQTEDEALTLKAQQAAQKLGLSFEYRYVGMGELATFMQQAQTLSQQLSSTSATS